MRAIRVKAVGGPEALEWSTTETPTPEADQVLVRIEAAGVNFIDTYQRSGLYPMDLPFTPGVEGAGTITELGSEVAGLEVGTRVAWSGPVGSYAETAALPAGRLIELPDAIDSETAAAVMLQGMTAHYLALDTHPLQSGDLCLIHAGAGGVGLLLIQIAKMRGATVFATVGTEEKAEIAGEAGADHVVVYTRDDFGRAVVGIAGPRPLHVVYDGVGADTFEAGLGLLRPRGMMVTFGNASGPAPEVSPLLLMRSGSLFLTRPTLVDYVAERAELERRAGDLFGWIQEGSLQVRVGATFALENAAEAHRALEGRRTTGKVLLVP